MTLLIVLSLFSQLTRGSDCIEKYGSTEKQIQIAKSIVKYYNKEEYSKMFYVFQKGRNFDNGYKMELEESIINFYSKLFESHGRAKIISINKEILNRIVFKLTFRKDPELPKFMVFYFNDSCIVQGFGFKNPDFEFPISLLEKKSKTINKGIGIENIMINTKSFNGAVLAIDQGKTIYKQCFGYSDFTEKTLVNDSTVFELASCSKQFTAMAIMILAEQGKLFYNDSIQKYVPDLPYHNITIEHLLTHTSGLPDYMYELEKYWDKNVFATNRDIVEIFKKYHPNAYSKPGEKFSYSNTGYALLSLVIEKASGMPYSDFLKKYIFYPIGMKNSRVFNTRRSKQEKIPNYAYGNIYSDSLKRYTLPDSLSDYKFVHYLDAITGDGCVNSTISDLELWDKALSENSLVSSATLSKAYSPFYLNNSKKTTYGYGVFTINKSGMIFTVYHSGSWPGYKTFILRFPDLRSSLVILSNNDYSEVVELGYKIAMILVK